MSNPNMTLSDFVQIFGGIEPLPHQRAMLSAISRGDDVRLVLAHPRRQANDELRQRPVSGGKVKDCTTGEVHEPTWTHRELDQR